MNNINSYFIIVQLLLFSSCLCEISTNQKEKFLNGFVEFYNNLPNQIYQSNEGFLQSVQKVDDTTYRIVANIKATEIHNIEATKNLECTATIQESEDDDVIIVNHVCQDPVPSTTTESAEEEIENEAKVEVTETTATSRHLQLENEVQSDTGITSGEQFIAIPRDQPSAPCIGCASHVNPQAPGVSDLASLGVRHLDLHEPTVKHSLDSVVDVERQVQVVNGVRYILTLLINSNNCTDSQTEDCVISKTCKVSILVKPWIKLPNGQNYRSILANNCTEPWQYGDGGEVLPEPTNDNDIQVKHNTEVQSVPNHERSLTDEELRSLQEQIIPNTESQETTEPFRRFDKTSPNTLDVSKQHVFKVESNKPTDNSVPVTESEKKEQQSFNINLDADKKKAIDDMLDFFDFSGFKPRTETEDVIPRVRRSYDYDLQVLSLAEDYHGIKSSIENARFMYEMAQAMVDYLNEMDMEVKNRAVKDVVKAEEETENLQRFVYIQARVTIPCDKVECEPTDVVTQICNGVIDSTNTNNPQILNTFCYNENKERDFREIVKEIPLDDPVLQKLAEEALKKIETESKSQHAMKISKIASAITQVTSGTLTKFSIIIENINCKKSVPLALRMNCTVLQQPGSKICEVISHERHWLNERKISYTCTDRPVEMRISKTRTVTKNVTVDDPKIVEMLQEAIQYLETQSEKNNKQKIVNINSISSQIIAWFLTKIEFVVGYTNCTDESKSRNEFLKCEVLKDEGLRLCKAQIWDRSWIMDGRQVEVSCDDVLKSKEVESARKKRSIDSIDGKGGRNFSSSKDNQIDYKKIAEESLKRFMMTLVSRQHYAVINVEKVKTQDEPGKLIRILFSISPTNCLIQGDGLLSSPKCVVVDPKIIFRCRSKVLQNLWIDKKQYFVNCNVKDNEGDRNSDGLKEQNLSNPKYYQLAEESLKKYMHDTENTQNHKIVRLEKVTTQIVSGLLTNIDFIISPITQTGSSNKTVKCHSKVLEKKWLGTKDFNVSCQFKSNHYDLLDTNLSNPKYMQMAVEALEQYMQNKSESHLLRVTFVDKVEHDGKSIKIRFLASHTEDDDGDTLCNAQFYETQIPRSNVDVICHSIGTVLKQIKVTEDDPKFSKYVQWAEESLHDYLQSTNTSQLYTIVSIENVTVKWEESIKTFIKFIISPVDNENSELQGKICQAEIKEKPWLHKKINTIKCEPEKELYRAKRQAPGQFQSRDMPGGLTEQDPTNPRYLALAEESLHKYLLENPHVAKSPEVVPVVEKVTTQVVSGSMTRIDFHFQALGAGAQQDRITMKCHSEVWERPWLNSKEITVTCSEVKAIARRGVPGGLTEQDPSNPRYLTLAEESLHKYLLENPHVAKSPEVVPVVEKVTTQVVSGSMTRIDFHFQALGAGAQQDRITMKCHSEVWERPWLNSKEITVTCSEVKALVRRGVPGGLSEQDPTNPRYLALAEESLHKYLLENPHVAKSPEVVPVVEKVTTQVVSGSMTRIDFHFQALGAGAQQDRITMKCHSEVWERPWLNSKEITVTCSEVKALVRRGVPGGLSEQDPTNPRYLALAEESLHKYLLENPHVAKSPEVVPVVEKVTTQVVSGSMTRIDFHFQALGAGAQQDRITMKCHSEVWERPWLNSKEITVTCSEVKAIVRRGVPGGLSEQDPTNPRYLALAEESLLKYLLENPHVAKSPEVVPVVEKVTTQVVSGSMTRIDFHFQALGAGAQQDRMTMKCHSEVWERPWLNSKEITVTCSEVKAVARRGVPGGLTEQDPTNPRYLALAEESLHKYLLENPHVAKSPEVVPVVEKVTTQVVSGSMTRIDFHFQALGAGAQQDRITMKCHSEVWERPWLNSKEITVTCSEVKALVRRGVPGGLTEQDPTNPRYLALAEESLHKYLLENPHVAKSPEVVPVVEKVTTQVVSGSMTRIDFHFQALGAGAQQDRITMKCHSEVWERPWLNSKEITVTCSEVKALVRRGVPGGLTEQDPTNPRYLALAEESLHKYLLENPHVAKSPEVVPVVEKVTTQVVSGSMTRIDFHFQALGAGAQQDRITMKCHSEVWERPWLNSKEITVTCSEVKAIARRGVPGGLTEQDPSNPRYLTLAEESLHKYLLENPHVAKSPEVVPVVEKVTTQVVSGSMTRIDFHFQALGAGAQQDRITMKCHSEVWERPWLNSKEITVTCSEVKAIVRRGVPGGLSEQDPTNPRYLALAEESLHKYLLENPHVAKSPEVVPVVEKVTTQVVSGSMTRIDFHFQALGAGAQQDRMTMKCHSEVWERPWLNSKEITVTCSEVKAVARRGVPGGLTEQDPSNPRYLALAEESLHKYLLENPHVAKSPEVVPVVEKVTTQVVSGSMTRIDFHFQALGAGAQQDRITMKCHSEVWERPWLKSKEITVTCSEVKAIVRRGVPGGLSEQDPTNPRYLALAEESLHKYLLENPHVAKSPEVVPVVEKVTTQVVSGSMTRIDFHFQALGAGAQQDRITMKCHSEVWERPWLNSKEITVTCSEVKAIVRRGVPGGLSEQDPTNPRYLALAEESLHKYLLENPHVAKSPEVVPVVEKVTTQVVSGSMTRIDFHFQALGAGAQQDRITMKCHSEVWERPWLNSKEITVTCSEVKALVRRGVPGGLSEQDPTNPRYLALAEESLHKYLLENPHVAKSPEVVPVVEKVTTQVVSGSMTRIDFHFQALGAGAQQDRITMKCHSEVWERPWLNSKEITVTCSEVKALVRRGVPGGLSEQDPTNPRYLALAEESLHKYLLENPHVAKSPEVVPVVEKVTTQVVSGSMTRIDFHFQALGAGAQQDRITMKCHSEVWERPWLNSKEITVTCSEVKAIVRRGVPGGLSEQDPTNPRYLALAEESLLKYLLENPHVAKSPEVVPVVEKVTTQVVSGSMTRIDFHFQALGAGAQQDRMTMKCHSEVWERPWLNSKEITVTCSEVKAVARRGVPGGLTEQDPTNPRYLALAEESLHKYLLENPHVAKSPEVVPVVEKVTTQVVSGSMTRIDFHFQALGAGAQQDRITMKCHSEVWERPWLNSKEITVTCSEVKALVRRGVPGGLTEQDPTNPRYLALAEESLHKYLLENPHVAKSPEVVPVVEKVTTQVVSGSMTRIDFHFQALGAGAQQDRITMKCHSEVWERPWLNSKEITVTCSEVKALVRRGVPGGLTEQDPTNPRYLALAEESLHKYLLENPHVAKSPEVVPVVEKVTTQVVSGSMTRIDFHFQALGAGAQQDRMTMKCHSEVWERPWLNSKEITVTCSEVKAIVRRGVPGGLSEQDPTNPRYLALAEESLHKYLLENPHVAKSPEVVPVVEKVTTQVVSGSMTRIDFHFQALGAGAQQDRITMKCHSEVWERPWLNSKEITVTCSEVKALVRRGVPGGLTEQDPTNPRYLALAEESLHKYLLENPHVAKSPEVVPVVEKVTTQVLSGRLTRIFFHFHIHFHFHFQALGAGAQQDRITMKCHSEVWERPWLNSKEITVTCVNPKKRVKRHLRVPSNSLKHNPVALNYEVLSDEKNSNQKDKELSNTLRGHIEEVEDPSKPEYKILAEEALRKYEQKSAAYHKVVEVKRVVTRVVSGLKYKINFNAAPTACLVNVTSVRARSCKPVAGVILYCHTEIWDQPWLKHKKIDVNCYDSADDSEEFSLKPLRVINNSSEKYIKLAEEASEKYLTTSNRKYVHKVTEILNASEQATDGILTTITFSLSPTTCLRNDTTKTPCNLKIPLVVFHCNAEIKERPSLELEKKIEVTCKKRTEQKDKKEKRDVGARHMRQTGDDDDEIDEETAFYYAERAIQHINDHSSSNNLHKLISIHAVQSSVQMGTLTVQMYLEVAETFCLRHQKKKDLKNCEEMNGLNHRLCLARLWPSPDDELVIRHVSVVCDDEENFESITGVNIPELLKMSIADLERPPEAKYKLVHQGEPQVIPSLDSKFPFKINFIIATTNCSKDVNLDANPFQCYVNTEIPSKSCHSFIWLQTDTKFVRYITAKCTPLNRVRRSHLDSSNTTLDNSDIQNMVQASLEKLEMMSLHRYKQRVLQINSYSTKITSGKVTTIDFDVGYTSCLKYEWVANVTNCDFLEHLPRRRCVAQIWERLWINNGQNIDVSCSDDETPLEAHIEFESAEMAYELAREALKHIEAKYPHPNKQKVVRIFSLEKQVVAGIHYKMKIEVGLTDCVALSDQTDCKFLKDHIVNKFCRVNVWVRPWTDHPPNFRVSCDFQEGTTHDLYHHVQAEHLFYNFLTTYSPSYVNDYSQMQKRFEIFKSNVKKIHELNVHEKGTARYGVTRFTDLTYEEFSSTYMGLKTNMTNENQVPMKNADIPNVKLPANFDWREYDAVTEVKDQGSCGSCWAFSVTGNIEGQWKMQSGKLVSLSEQELVDCDKMDDGCNGGLPDNAYRAIEQMGGLELESDYPYEGVDEKCVFNKTLAKVQISGAVNITKNETGMAQWLVHNGPISIGINANAMQFYMGGISHPWKMLCNPTNLDHGVLIVGYGIKDYPLFHKKLPYWIVKNSWGKSWGEQGYYRVYRGDGTCGVNQMASSAVI